MVSVETREGAIEVSCPYSREFVDFAHMRNGIWKKNRKVWLFDPKDEFAVRTALIDIYGTDDYESCDKVDCRVHLDVFDCGKELFFLGRLLAKRKHRDYSVMTGDGVVIVEGGFPSSGGSMRHPALEPEEGTVLEVRGVPRQLAEREHLADPDCVEIVSGINREVLLEEKERLKKRIAEIDRMLDRLEEKQEDGEIIADLQDDADEPPETVC